MLNVRKLMTGSFAILGIAVLWASGSAAADVKIQPTQGTALTPTFKASAIKVSPQPAGSINTDQQIKIKAALKKAMADFTKNKSASKFMNGGAHLDLDSQTVYRSAAAGYLSSSGRGGRYMKVGQGPALQQVPPTYAIESGEIVSATFADPCDGTIQVSYTIKNRGAKPAGTVPKLFASLTRDAAPSVVISSGFMNLPFLVAGGTTTVQFPPLRHRNPGSCAGNDLKIDLNFVDVEQPTEYRLKVTLKPDQADATLQTGLFMNIPECSVGQRCSTGVCSVECPPCPAGYTEQNGGCVVDGPMFENPLTR